MIFRNSFFKKRLVKWLITNHFYHQYNFIILNLLTMLNKLSIMNLSNEKYCVDSGLQIYTTAKTTRHRMRSLLVLTTILFIIIIKLISKIYILNKKIKYVDEANMWHKLAVTDDLTGVYNRNAYNLHINEIEPEIEKNIIGVIIFDVDDFKIINDTKGHLEGDRILKNVANTLLDVFSEPEYRVFRMGGDEFLVLSKHVSEQDMIERLITLDKRLEMDGNIRLSKGYSMVKDTPEKAFKYADEMLYADKISKKLRSSCQK